MFHFKKQFSYFFIILSTFSQINSYSLEGLPALEKALMRDFELLNYPAAPIKKTHPLNKEEDPVYDVAIIGGGMAGLTAAAALFREGISHLRLFDQSAEGLEGPWLTYARMKTLRSNKTNLGPALGIPHLTFRAWYEAQYGLDSWNELDKISNALWMDYLKWYRQVLRIPVDNECKLVAIQPFEDYFLLEFNRPDGPYQVKALKVVLATGRGGFGGPLIPDFVENLPTHVYAHVMEEMNFRYFKDKKIGIVGGGSSALDAAAVALEVGAEKVELIIRSACLPCINKFALLPEYCFRESYYKMSEKWRWQVMNHILLCTVPPPEAALKRVSLYNNFSIQTGVFIQHTKFENDQIVLETSHGYLTYDFLMLATGYSVNAGQQPELQAICSNMSLWRDQADIKLNQCNQRLGLFPYLGSSFEFLEKNIGETPYLKNLYCFNFASMLSHGRLSSDIQFISEGAKRLAQGIAADFIKQNEEIYLELLENQD